MDGDTFQVASEDQIMFKIENAFEDSDDSISVGVAAAEGFHCIRLRARSLNQWQPSAAAIL